MNKLVKNIFAAAALLCCIFTNSSCESGLTYEEAPEATYSEVGVSGFTVRSRELFTGNKIWAVNFKQWVESYINTQQIGTMAESSWTNESGASFTLLDGTVVANGETVKLKGTQTTEADSSVPGGTLYVLNVYARSKATYQTMNKGYLFDATKFSGDFELVDPVEGRSTKVVLPVRKNEVIGELNLVDYYNCVVEPIDGAPKLGYPSDFSKPARYLVKNICYLPAGVEQHKRVYEVRITFLP